MCCRSWTRTSVQVSPTWGSGSAGNRVQSFCISAWNKNWTRPSNTPTHICGRIMSFSFSKELRQKYNVCSMPVWKADEVQVAWRHYEDRKIDKVIQIYRKNYVICMEQMQWRKASHLSGQTGIHSQQSGHRQAKAGWKLQKTSSDRKPGLTS